MNKRTWLIRLQILLLFLISYSFSGEYVNAEMTGMALQERTKRADIVLVGTIVKSYDTGIIKEARVQNWHADCQVKQVLKGGLKDKSVQIYFIQIPYQSEPPQRLEEQKTYLLFLNYREKNMPPHELITPYHGAFDLGQTHWIHDGSDTKYPRARQMQGEEIVELVSKIINKQ